MLSRRMTIAAAAGAASALLCAGLAAPQPAAAARPIQVTRALDYLHARQGADGRFQDAAYTPWAILAIAASGENPDAAAWSPSGKSPVDFLQTIDLEAYAGAGATGNAPSYYAKMILAYVAAGRRSSISGAGSKNIDLVSKLLTYQRSDGRLCPTASSNYIGAVNTTIWSIIALEAAGAGSSARSAAVGWLKGQQLADGGFGTMAKDGPGTPASDVDDTAAAIQALVAAGVSPSSSVVTGARAYLRGAQRSDGGFSSSQSGGYTYSESTAWALQAILGLGESPAGSAWTTSGKNPQTALRGLQAANGSLYHRNGVISTVMLSTTQSLVALAGKTFATFPRGSVSWVTPFVATPSVTSLSPANGAALHSTTVLVKAAYRDGAGGTGIAVSGVRLTVDGRDMTKQADVSASKLSVKLTGATAGTHTIKVAVHDRAGNARSLTHRVTIGGGASGTQPDASGPDGAASSGGSTPEPGVTGGGASTGAGTSTDAPAAAFPSGDPQATASAAPSGAPATQPAAGTPEPAAGGKSQAGQMKEERRALFLFGLALVPTAIGFCLADRSHRRSWSAIGDALERTKRSDPTH